MTVVNSRWSWAAPALLLAAAIIQPWAWGQGPRPRFSGAEFTIRIPPVDSPMFMSEMNDCVRELERIAQTNAQVIATPDLNREYLARAMTLMDHLGPELGAPHLVKLIDVRDDRGQMFAGLYRGRYPAVAILVGYGAPPRSYYSPVERAVYERLREEDNPLRRQLLCDVLRRIYGQEEARKRFAENMTSYLASQNEPNRRLDRKLYDTRKKRLDAATEELAKELPEPLPPVHSLQ